MGIYKFNKQDAIRFALENGIKYQDRGNQIRFNKCPYCRQFTNDRDTFAISATTGQFNCMRASCGAKGNMITLHKDFGFSLGTEVDNYYDQGFKRFREIHLKKPVSKDPAVRYMQSRGISEEVTRKYGVTTRKDNDNILVFPFLDENGIMSFIKYRKTDFDKTKDKNKEWCEKDCKPILFGMSECNFNNKRLVMTEGQIDSMSVAEAGIENAVSVPTGKNGFTWIPYCWDFLGKFQELVIFGDYERGDISLLSDMKSRFHGKVLHVAFENYRGCKDANELLQKYGKEAVKKAVEEAVPVRVESIKDITEVRRVDVNSLTKISSGLPTVDKLLGGFYLGQLVILTGERGEGKSTLAGQFATKSLQQGYNVFFYSGELMDWYFKSWLDFQTAGSAYINTRETDYGTQYSIDGNQIPLIDRWYKGRLKLYDNDVIYKDEHESLVETITKAITQYGCSVIFLDNLMTAIDDDGKLDVYRQQSNFVKRLVNIAKSYNVLIFLIAHPRKSNGFEFGNDSIAGSSNITNLADVVMSYGSPKVDPDDPPEYVREIKIFKNRLTGRTTKKLPGGSIPLWFEESSKRISESDYFGWTLGWEKQNDYGFVEDITTEDVPFD